MSMFKLNRKPTAEETAMLRACASSDENVAKAAQRELATALTTPLKKGVLKGDILAGIFSVEEFEPGAVIEYPLDFIAPGTEREHVAYTMPNVGRVPERHVEGDYLTIPTYRVANSIDWNLKYARDARWNIVGRAMQVIEAGFIRKANQDGFRTLLAAAAGRNLNVYDDAATSGLFTKRLIRLMQDLMRRNAGGNSTSVNRGKLTDFYLSPEAHGDVLSWDLTQIPDAARLAIWQNFDNGGVAKIGSVALHDIDEFGVNQEFQLYCTAVLGVTMPTDKVELCLGLDLSSDDSFVNPVRQEVQVFEDMSFHRLGRAGMYAWREHGFGVFDSRRLMFGSL